LPHRLSLTTPPQQRCLTSSPGSCSAPLLGQQLPQRRRQQQQARAQRQPQLPHLSCRSAASCQPCLRSSQMRWWCWPLLPAVLQARQARVCQLCRTLLAWCRWSVGTLSGTPQQALLQGEFAGPAAVHTWFLSAVLDSPYAWIPVASDPAVLPVVLCTPSMTVLSHCALCLPWLQVWRLLA
jgi:hypothetical protein